MGNAYAIFSARYLPEVGGVENYTYNLAHELVLMGNEVTIVSNALAETTPVETQEDGVRVVRLPARSFLGGRLPIGRKGKAYRELLSLLEDFGIDRVLVNTRFYDHSLVGLRFARKVGASALVVDHGAAYLTLGNPAIDEVIKGYEHVMTARCKRFQPRFGGVSKASTEWLRTFGVATDLVIPNAIDACAFRDEASSRDFRHELNVSSGQILVASVGRLAPEKGSRELVEAARILGDGFQVAIAGEGSLRPALEAALPSNVTLLGNLGHPDLSALLSQADLFCLPTRSEGFCTSLLEAGAWGLTPVITHVGGADEVMGSPVQFGALLPDMRQESVAAVLEQVASEGRVGHSADLRRHVENDCSWKASASALVTAFDSM